LITPAVAARLAAVGGHDVGIRRVVRHDPSLAVHLGRDRAFVVHRHRGEAVEPEPARGHRPEHAGRLVEHHNRCAPRADDRAHLAGDRLRGLLELDRLAQDLADGVEEVDLLVAAGQLLAQKRPLALRLQQRADQRQEPRGRAGQLAVGQAGDLEEEAFDLGHGLEPHGAGGRGREPRRPRHLRRHARIGPGGEAEGAPVEAPQAHPSVDERAEAVEHEIEPPYGRRSIMQMEFPCSLKRTSSTSFRMR
jgi:hypothetical protein